jgi:hypothetical protein
MPSAQAQFSLFHFRPRHALRLHHTEKAGATQRLKMAHGIRQRMLGAKVANNSPSRLAAARGPFPFFDREETARHKISID